MGGAYLKRGDERGVGQAGATNGDELVQEGEQGAERVALETRRGGWVG